MLHLGYQHILFIVWQTSDKQNNIQVASLSNCTMLDQLKTIKSKSLHILILTQGNAQVLTVDLFSKTVCVQMVGKL